MRQLASLLSVRPMRLLAMWADMGSSSITRYTGQHVAVACITNLW